MWIFIVMEIGDIVYISVVMVLIVYLTFVLFNPKEF